MSIAMLIIVVSEASVLFILFIIDQHLQVLLRCFLFRFFFPLKLALQDFKLIIAVELYTKFRYGNLMERTNWKI
jgi:hypothetical protein